MTNEESILIKMIVDAWKLQLDRANKLFNGLTDEELCKETAPGRNTGIYLMGHLAAIHDALFPLLGLGEKLEPQMDELFISNPDRSGLSIPPVSVIRKYWSDVNTLLNQELDQYSIEDWLDKHRAITAEDFIKAPHRNKLNVLLTRTTHLANHLGQLTYLVNNRKTE